MKRLLLIFAFLLTVCFAQAQWEDDVRLSETSDTSFLYFGKSHCIATNGDTVHVVWYEKTENNWEIFYKRSTDSGYNWDGEIRLTYTEEFSQYPSVSVYGSLVYVIWEEFIDGNWEICFIRSMNGGEDWGEIIRLTEDQQISYWSAIASNGSYVHVAWVSKDMDEQTWKILYKYSTDAGLNWSDETWLSPNSPDAYNVSLSVSQTDVYVAWNDNRDWNLEIYYRKSSDNGTTWEPETRLTYDQSLSRFPCISASGSNVDIVWEDYRSTFNDIYFKCSIDGGENWGEDIQVTNNPAGSFFPNLVFSNSVLHIVWQDTRGGVNDIYYNWSLDGGATWAGEMQLNNFSFSSERPFIAVSGPVLHVIWQDYRDFNYEIYYKQNSTGGLVGIEDEPLSTSGGLISVYPNPASRLLTVDSRQSAVSGRRSAVCGRRSAVRLSIADLYGREIKEFVNISLFPYQIDISDLTNGVFILKMNDDSGNVGSVKFLKISDK
ncbi:MAG: hypothetical protein M0Q51_08660 [Bacteroidales bacterium]|nr:hypothetical protein [Bacteroidales bacterium]